MKTVRHLLSGIGVVIGFMAAFSSVRGQSGTTPGTRGRIDPVQNELQRKFEMEIIENALRGGTSRRAPRYAPLVTGAESKAYKCERD